MRYSGRALHCLGLEVQASDLLANNQTYVYLNRYKAARSTSVSR